MEEQGIYYSLCGVGGDDLEAIRTVARRWLEKGTAGIVEPGSIADLPAPAAAAGWSRRAQVRADHHTIHLRKESDEVA